MGPDSLPHKTDSSFSNELRKRKASTPNMHSQFQHKNILTIYFLLFNICVPAVLIIHHVGLMLA